MKQEQNIQRLKTYFRAIEVSFHDNKENFNTTMTYCSIHHLELLENFEYYADMFQQEKHRKENMFIPLQGLFKFWQIMGLADSTIEIMQWGSDFLHEIDGLNVPFSDTLNLMNGVNYA